MDNQALQKIKDTIAAGQQVSIAVSQNPNIDQMAAALSLSLSLQAQGKKVTVVSPTEPIVELSSLVGIDKVKTSNEGSAGDLVVSFPYREGEIEKVSYTIENGSLNIVVKAGEAGLTFSEQDVQFKRGADKPELLFTIGVARMADIEGIFSAESLQDVTIINIDNNSTNEGYGTMVLVSPKFSSLSEQVADLMLNLGYEIDVDASQNLLSGIITATNNFQIPTTSYLAFEIASILMKKGAVRPNSSRVNQPQPQVQAPVRPQVQNAPMRQPQQQRPQQPRPQQQPQPQREDRQDRRDAIREALRVQSQNRNEQKQEQPRRDDFQNQQPRPQPQAQQQPQQDVVQSDQKPPSDWLTPKVYKGSSSV
ncbi:hypothetical protein BH09PAT1_BH09PAT1_2060 [soil metagenome]